MGLRIFSFFDAAWHADIPALDMAGIYDTTGKTTLALRKRRQFLLAEIKVPPGAVRAPFVDQFSVCGKRNCQGRHGGEKHGPYYYLPQCLGVGQVNKFPLTPPAQQRVARVTIDSYRLLVEQLEELSRINTELLRRHEALGDE